MESSPGALTSTEQKFDLALLSDVGNERPGNEDACGHYVEGPDAVLFAVADGVGGYEGGEIASRMAVDITLQAYRENPASWGASKRLHRAVQQANIEIHDKALTVPELRRMSTTLTAVVVEKGTLSAVHVGDCRLYLVRDGRASQISKDHTVVAERVRMGLMTAAKARTHPERSILLRSLGQELIVSIDRIAMPLVQNDRLILCSDGLHNVLNESYLEALSRDVDAETGCRKLIDAANQRGTADNVTCAIFKMMAPTGLQPTASGWRDRLRALLRR